MARSLESALEEERLAILELLQGPARPTSPPNGPASRTVSPNRGKPVKSLIDAASDFIPASEVPPPLPSSSRSSPTLTHSQLHRPGGTKQHDTGAPRLLKDLDKDPNSNAFSPAVDYRFNVIPSPLPPAPKRTTQKPSKKNKSNLKSMIDLPSEKEMRKMINSNKRASSPISKAALHHAQYVAQQQQRSQSPGVHSPRSSTGQLLSTSAPAHVGGAVSPRLVLPAPDGQMIDLDYAYRRLTDEALQQAGGVLAELPERKEILDASGQAVKAGSGETVTKDGGVRLQKDEPDFDQRGEGNIKMDSSEDSEEESDADSVATSEDEATRGRKKARGGKAKGQDSPPKRKTMSLLAAAEEERKSVVSSKSQKYKVKSLLPSVSVTPPPGTSRKNSIYPSTSFDLASGTSTPMSSDVEADLLDLKRAQKMEMVTSPIVSNPETNRAIRSITRGDYDELQNEAEMGSRRQRSYLVATDLSSEAAYALEWTIGTVLRDGDTLLAISAMEEDGDEKGGDKTIKPEELISQAHLVGFAGDKNLLPTHPNDSHESGLNSFASTIPSVNIDTTTSSTSTLPPPQPNAPLTSSPLASPALTAPFPGSVAPSRNHSRDRTSKSEAERIAACESITTLIQKLLKRTRLQVRVVIEVIHCKSPKHLLTEVIDYIEPTLVVLGSRGRSALKGVLLGSFSNYLVTKSSVPVMVARKKLKHHNKKAKAQREGFAHSAMRGEVNVRLSNNLPGLGKLGGKLAGAKVD